MTNNTAPPILRNVTVDQLVARRTQILSSQACSLFEFDMKTNAGTLTGRQWHAKGELEAIGYLLGESHRNAKHGPKRND